MKTASQRNKIIIYNKMYKADFLKSQLIISNIKPQSTSLQKKTLRKRVLSVSKIMARQFSL